ncbi:Adenylate kinase [Methylobacterium sp. 174MFSha1.1]|uniref:AAA family ATPase n=1 Tax=Methylobacterium sp. 174MFSha1.1 TaxID=1502749 RepID=UPI0008EE8F8B|nr:AAA family ATPase [Methylobacterium sp. 174MFSha1.1]SFV01661.1 Adenylate kinase [Methylobacterium sp. 174MFSha1.1]
MPNTIGLPEATVLLRSAKRVLIFGSSGAGKSTLSSTLGRQLDLPHLSMDRDFYWLPGWVARPREEYRALIAAAVASERWIMDGSFPSSLDLRLPRTDLAIWLRLPRLTCLAGVIRRGIAHRGRTRPDMAPGCPEQLPDREFLSYVWNFERDTVPAIIRGLDAHGPDVPTLVIRSRGEADKLVAAVAFQPAYPDHAAT